jgi:hypothetical protein
MRVEVLSPDGNALTARLLDRTGKPLAIPLTTTTREDDDGARWVTTQVALAPLAPGDYVIELSAPPDILSSPTNITARGAPPAGTPPVARAAALVAFRIVP